MKLDRPQHCAERGHPVVGIIHTGIGAEQNFSQRLVTRGVTEGWLKIDGGRLTLHAQPEDLVYDVVREPGYYVKSTGQQIPISALAMAEFLVSTYANLAAAEARAFLAGKGLEPTDYEATRGYHCVLNEAQQAKFRAVRDIAGNVVAAHTLEG